MSQNRLGQRGPNARRPAALPSLQVVRLADPQAQKAFDAIREWLEVRLGSRGDPFERATTLRELEQKLAPIAELMNKLRDFDGSTETLRSSPVGALPTEVRLGAIMQFEDGSAFLGTVKGWKKLTLTDP